VTSPKPVDHLKARMLKDAVDSNLDAIHGRLPQSLRPVRRHVLLWSRQAARLGALYIAVVMASAGVARTPASARVVPDSAVAPVLSNARTAPNLAPDPSFLSHVRPSVLALSVRRVIVDAGHGGGNLGTSSADGVHEKDVTLDIAERVRQLIVQRGFEAVMTRTADETR